MSASKFVSYLKDESADRRDMKSPDRSSSLFAVQKRKRATEEELEAKKKVRHAELEEEQFIPNGGGTEVERTFAKIKRFFVLVRRSCED